MFDELNYELGGIDEAIWNSKLGFSAGRLGRLQEERFGLRLQINSGECTKGGGSSLICRFWHTKKKSNGMMLTEVIGKRRRRRSWR